MTRPLYQWIPGRGPSPEAIGRMRRHFPKPKEPMGEAWFMGERKIFHEWFDTPVLEMDAVELSGILFQISSGTGCFGHFQEWEEWFRYMLPDLILRSTERSGFELLAQSVACGIMSIFWRGFDNEYEGFRDDVLDSFSLCLMSEKLWARENDKFQRPRFLAEYRDGADNIRLPWEPGWASGDLSAMMFFCLKYLGTEEIAGWAESIVKIDDVYWRGALMHWLEAAIDVLRAPVITPGMVEKAKPIIKWSDSHLLAGLCGSIDTVHPPDDNFNDNQDFIPAENPKIFLEEMQKHLTEEVMLEWAVSFSQNELIAYSSRGILESLMEKGMVSPSK